MPFKPAFTLLPIALALAGYWLLLRHTLVSGQWLPPVLLTACFALVVLAVNFAWSVARWRQQFTTSPPSRWRDGQAVAFEARLQAGTVPLHAPASGAERALYT